MSKSATHEQSFDLRFGYFSVSRRFFHFGGHEGPAERRRKETGHCGSCAVSSNIEDVRQQKLFHLHGQKGFIANFLYWYFVLNTYMTTRKYINVLLFQGEKWAETGAWPSPVSQQPPLSPRARQSHCLPNQSPLSMTQALPRAIMTKQATRTQAPPPPRHRVGDTRNLFTAQYTKTARKVTPDRAGQKWVLTSVIENFYFH